MSITSQPDDPIEPVIITVTLESLRRKIHHAIMADIEGLNDTIKAAVDKAFSDFRFDSRFYNYVNDQVEKAVFNEVANRSHQVMSALFKNPDFEKRVLEELLEKVAQKGQP